MEVIMGSYNGEFFASKAAEPSDNEPLLLLDEKIRHP